MFLALSEPFYVGDSAATYMLESASGALASQEYLFVVNPETRLLSYVNSNSEGQAGQILLNLSRSISGVDAVEEAARDRRGDRLIYSRIVDPFALAGCDFGTACDFRAVNEDLRAGALSHFSCAAPDGGTNPALCARIEADPDFFRIRLEPLFDAAAVSAGGGAPDDCRRSICYRSAAPYTLSLKVAGVADVSEIVGMPNEGPVMALKVPAGVFARSRARVELYQGMPARYAADRRNELVAITLLPFQIVREGFSAASEVFQFRINYNNARVSQLQSEARREAAEDERRRRRRDERRLSSASARADMSLLGDVAESSRVSPMEDETGALGEGPSTLAAAPAPTGRLFEVDLAGGAGDSGSGADLDQ